MLDRDRRQTKEPRNQPVLAGRRIRRCAPLLATGILVCAFFWLRMVASAETDWGGDLPNYYYPLYEGVYARMVRGTLPLWNPYELCGVPLLATLQGGFFYPLHALYLVLPTHVALGALALLHLLVAGVAATALAGSLGLGAASAVLAGVLFAIRGSLPGHIYHPNLMEAAAWLAPGALAVLGLARGGGARSAVGLAAALGLSLLAGYPQASLFCVYAWAALLIVFLVAERQPGSRWAGSSGAFALAVLLGALLAGIQLLPAIELLPEGTRTLEAPPPWPVRGDAPLHLALAELLATRNVSPRLALSFGVVGLVLVPLSLAGRRRRRLALGLLALGLLSLGFALGPPSPVYTLLRALPFMGSFRLPERALFVTDLSFALVAACGLDVLSRARFGARGGERRSRWGGLATTGALLVAVLALVEIFSAPARRGWLPYASRGQLEFYDGERKLFSFLAAQPERMWPRLGSGVPEKAPMVFGMRSVAGFEPLNLRRQAEYFSYFAYGRLEADEPLRFAGPLEMFLRKPWNELERRRLLDLASVRYVLDDAALARRDRRSGLRLLPRLEERALVVLENPRALPRAFVAHRVERAPETEKLLAILSGADFDPRVVSYVEDDLGFETAPGAPTRGTAAEIVVDEAQVVEIEVESPAPGLLVLADTYYRGWRATVDGQPVPITRTNHLFRGVPLGAGSHRVRFEFRPRSLWWGAVATLLAASVLLGIWIRAPQRPLPRPGS